MMDFRKSNNARYVTFGSETEVKVDGCIYYRMNKIQSFMNN